MYKRVLLKISGEALAAGRGFGVDAVFIHEIANEIAQVARTGCQIAIVVGGGNFFRGVSEQAIHMDRVAADHMGMLSTVINAIALQDAIEKTGLYARVMSAIEMHEVAEPYIRRRAIRHLEKGRVVIFAGGTGNPYFSTDTAAALRAMEIGAEVLLKATSVEGIYTADPEESRRRDEVRNDHLHGDHQAGPARHGYDGRVALQRQQSPDDHLLDARDGEHRAGRAGRKAGLAGYGLTPACEPLGVN